MKNLIKSMQSIATYSRRLCAIAIAAVIGFSMVACGDVKDGDPGILKITNFGDSLKPGMSVWGNVQYNGRLAFVFSEKNPKSGSVNENGKKINSGDTSIVLRVWEVEGVGEEQVFKPFTGNVTIPTGSLSLNVEVGGGLINSDFNYKNAIDLKDGNATIDYANDMNWQNRQERLTDLFGKGYAAGLHGSNYGENIDGVWHHGTLSLAQWNSAVEKIKLALNNAYTAASSSEKSIIDSVFTSNSNYVSINVVKTSEYSIWKTVGSTLTLMVSFDGLDDLQSKVVEAFTSMKDGKSEKF